MPAGDPSAGGSRIASTELNYSRAEPQTTIVAAVCVNEQAYIKQAAADTRLANGCERAKTREKEEGRERASVANGCG